VAPKTKKRPAARRPPTKAQIAAREAKHRRDLIKRVAATVVVVVVVAGVVLGFVITGKGKNQTAQPISATQDSNVQCAADEKFDPGSSHTTDKVTYTVDPPAGGDHNPNPAAPGIYDEGKSPGDSRIVHALEHGYIAIWYNPDSGGSNLAKLENLWKNYKYDVILIARRTLPSSFPVTATAWHHRLLCSGTDDFQLNEFIQQYVNQGPEKIPHNIPPEGRNPRT
jgi:hypothetical protein